MPGRKRVSAKKPSAPKKLRKNQPLTMSNVVRAGMSAKDLEREVWRRFSSGTLRSGNAKTGPVVTNKYQAYVIAKSMASKLASAKRKYARMAKEGKRRSGQDDYILGQFERSLNPATPAGEYRNPVCFGSAECASLRRYGGLGHDFDRS